MAEFISLKVTSDDNVPKLASYPISVASAADVSISAKCKGKGKKRKYILQSSHQGLPFEAHDYSSQNLSKYAVGYMDEKKGELELLPAHHIFIMEKVCDTSEADINDILSPLSHQQRKASLTEAFGSKKKKRAMKALESNTISADSISAASSISQLIVASNESGSSPQEAAGIVAENAAKDALVAQREVMLPPHDMSAMSLAEAYPVTGMIPGPLHYALKEWVTAIAAEFGGDIALPNQDQAWIEKLRQDQSPVFITDGIAQTFARHRSKPKDLRKKLQLLLLYNVQLKFCKMMIESRRAVEKEEFLKSMAHPPLDVFRHLTNSFAVFRKAGGKAAFTGTKALTDKALMHTIVLSLHINDGIAPISRICEFLKISASRLNALAKESGCTVTKTVDGDGSGDTTFSAQLTLPLKFPDGKRGRKSRG